MSNYVNVPEVHWSVQCSFYITRVIVIKDVLLHLNMKINNYKQLLCHYCGTAKMAGLLSEALSKFIYEMHIIFQSARSMAFS